MRLANHRVSALARPSRAPVYVCAMMRAVRLDTRAACVSRPWGSLARSGGGRRHSLGIREPMDTTARDGCQRVTAAS
jgi:hypothetical protein